MTSHRNRFSSPGWPRLAVAGTASIIASILWSHTLAALLRPLAPPEAPLAAAQLTLAAIVVAVLGIATWRSRYSALLVAAAGALAGVVLHLAQPGIWAPSLSLAAAGCVASELGRRLAPRLPHDLDRTLARRGPALLWLCLSLLAIVQIGRLSTFMTDPEADWVLATGHPFWAQHECLPAYFYGAELSQRDAENLYDVRHYPGLDPQAEPITEIAGMRPEDPFQYPPQFLLLPRLAIALSQDYPTLRSVWFGLQATLFLAVAGWLTLWVGGRRGRLAAFLLPLAVTAFPTLYALQYGQFHLTAVTLGVAALLAFEARRRALGGGLLAIATLSKIFPGLLLVVLAVQRRWRDLAWTTGAMGALTVAAWIVLGPAPFVAFFDYQLPRLASGQAFAFGEVWPEIRTLVLADNQGAFGLIEKLSAIGVPGLDRMTAVWGGKLFALMVLALAARFAWLEVQIPRDLRAAGWLAILGLGSMTSPGAFGDYVPLAATWMMTVLASRMRAGWRIALPLGVFWVLQYFVLGTSPLGSWFSPEIMLPLSALSAASMMAVFGGVLLGSFEPAESWTLDITPQEVMAELDPGVAGWPSARVGHVDDLLSRKAS